MSDSIIQEQIAYYRARAGEYDEWFYRIGRYDHGEELNQRWFDEAAQVMRALHQLAPVGDVLELACGTGIWTRELLKVGQHITAIDASPEVIEINRAKLQSPNVEYQQADLFAWEPEREYDLVAFAFWLSHVPPEQLDDFLSKVHRAVRPGGKIFMVDSRSAPTSTAKDNPIQKHGDAYQVRRLKDGREFKIVKVFYEPQKLGDIFTHAGFDAIVKTTENYFIYATGTRKQPRERDNTSRITL
jgi:demethylmenaquinone methyltransferase/2-methoxy-6-polyprenyl-1,4-benzoquinol methylase